MIRGAGPAGLAAGTPVTRVSEPANHRVSAADPADRSVLCFEIPCQVGDEIWTGGWDGAAWSAARARCARHVVED
ncbi:hypothetical protein [Nonomuraea endophytica]|uniref:Uncharacterized protein n=1 Tax=Nonomuraea endophytica TaxID=714136 RepID=A0A7W8ACE4_9ACTN|nr:hypothetical protein [Nonomuraea endophytica]MBB5083535.1 hypothetical protein [Nonomuraea endophytica]